MDGTGWEGQNKGASRVREGWNGIVMRKEMGLLDLRREPVWWQQMLPNLNPLPKPIPWHGSTWISTRYLASTGPSRSSVSWKLTSK